MARRALLTLLLALPAGAQDLVVGSKPFTEGRLLGEILRQAIAGATGLEVEHRTLNGTKLCFDALRAGQIDLYPEYTGTGWAELLHEAGAPRDPLHTFLHVQRRCREEYDLEWLAPLGLNNTYALALVRARAEELGVTRISDLAAHAGELRAGFSIEFTSRADGWAGLGPHYGLELERVRSLEHALAYEALAAGELDLIDAYSTDAKLLRYDLVVLEDDRDFFPPYHAAPLVNGDTLREHPELRTVLEDLAFSLTDARAMELNHRVEVGGEDFATVARDFLAGLGAALPPEDARAAPLARLGRRVFEHLRMTFLAVLLAAALALPLGIAIVRRPYLRRVALGFASVMQTVPSLALLAFLIALPGLGLDGTTAVVALFLYALLPILRNTHAGLTAVDPALIEAARGLGLTPRQVLLRVQLPLATGTVVAGLRTATVISIGVATLAAFIGAGGLGEPILEGLYLNDTALVLSGAVPAALLALAADAGLGAVQRVLTPRGLG